MRFRSPALRVALSLAAVAAIPSCGDGPLAPGKLSPRQAPSLVAAVTPPAIVISQVYGGGGNSGATLKNDFIELFNPGSTAVNVTGWSVQYASALGTTWQVTTLSGTIQPGAYYLIQEQAGAGGTVNLPTPDATGSGIGIAMAAGAGKVFLASNSTGLTTACPTANVVDKVSYGLNAGTVSDCGFGVTGATLSATLAALRNDSGCAYTQVLSADFTSGAPNPRNSASAVHLCGGPPPNEVATVEVATTPPGTPATVNVGNTISFAATGFDASHNPVATTFTWSSSDQNIATVNATTGVATGVAAGPVNIIATAANNVTGSAALTVSAGPPPPPDLSGQVVISQIYAGGGNSGATFKNDFIEIFNRSTQTVSLTGWSVQRTSVTGTTWDVVPLTGSIPAGGYYLIQEAAGAGGTVNLPTPDAIGTANMGATNGKVVLAQTTTAFTIACPSGTVVVDIASYGAGTDCGNSAPAPSATVADIRKHGGCTWTPNPTTDFATGAPTPRNSASPAHSCVVGPIDHVVVTGNLTVLVGGDTQLSAEALDANDNTVSATFTWSTSDVSIATVNVTTGLVHGVTASGTPASITVVAMAGGDQRSTSVDVAVQNPGGINWVDLSISSTSFPPGFQAQIFATARESQGGTIIPATYTFESVEPDFIDARTVQNTGSPTGTTTSIVTGVAAPPDAHKPGIRITATPTGGGTPFVFVTHSITIEPPVAAPLSIYGTNDDFGDPSPGSGANDFLIRRSQYVLSYNQSRGTPNWVSYELDARQIVPGADRCNCFTADPLLPAAAQIFTSDYTNGGYDRGHMTRSFDRTAANVDNAISFYLTNIVPQKGDLNQGVWAQFENMLGDSARVGGRAVYIITGPLYNQPLTYIKNEGKIAIPNATWKVALIGPGNSGNPFTHTNVQNWSDISGLSILAVMMPNIDGVRNDPPSKYFTTVEAIEEATGYDLLSLLNASFTTAIQHHDHAPTASFLVTGTPNEGVQLSFDGSASSDPDIANPPADLGRTEALSFSWHFSDGTDATGATVNKTFANHGSYTATLTVTDAFGWPTTSTQTINVGNLPPSASFVSPAAGSEGAGFTLSLNGGTDPSPVDAAALKYSFDCGTGTYSAPTSTSSITCTPTDNGTLAVRGKVIDTDGLSAEYTGSVIVANVAPTASFTAPDDVSAGFPIALSLTGASDASSADIAAGLQYAFDCGDGAGFQAATASSSANCPTTQNESRTVRGRVIDKDGGATTYTASVTVTRRITALGAATFWVGLKNSDDVGLRVDVLTEVLVDGSVVGSGVAENVGTGSSGFNNAQLGTVALALTNGAAVVPPGAQVGVRTSVRRTCSPVNGHNAGRVQLWYNGQPVDNGAARDAGTRFDATITGIASSYFSRLGSLLSVSAGSTRSTVEVQVNSQASCPNRPFSALGTWSVTMP